MVTRVLSILWWSIHRNVEDGASALLPLMPGITIIMRISRIFPFSHQKDEFEISRNADTLNLPMKTQELEDYREVSSVAGGNI
jgi:hypothetical protein